MIMPAVFDPVACNLKIHHSRDFLRRFLRRNAAFNTSIGRGSAKGLRPSVQKGGHRCLRFQQELPKRSWAG